MNGFSTDNPAATSPDDTSDDLMFQFDLRGVGELALAEEVVRELEQPSANQAPHNLVTFPVDREDLLALADHWTKVILHEEEMWFLLGHESSCRNARYARHELERLGEVLGDDTVKEVWEAANLAMRRRFGDVLWGIYEHGTEEERDRVVEQTHAHISYCDEKLADSTMKARAMTYLRTNPNGLFVDEAGDLWSLVDANRDPFSKDDRLTLMLTTRSKGSALDPTTNAERPAGWVTPTWSGRWWQS